MKILQKIICDRCYALYHAELTAEGWFTIEADKAHLPLKEGICSYCGRVEGRQTVQISLPKDVPPSSK